MSRILNFGSINIDYVYEVEHFVRSGETISSHGLKRFEGGKGQNQSIALAKAGANVYHAGMVGNDGEWLISYMKSNGVDSTLVSVNETNTGNAIIQVDKTGQNCIILYAGANHQITSEYIDTVLSHFEKGDIVVLQNEINKIDEIIDKAYEKGLLIAFNPSPIDDNIKNYDLTKVTWFFINEIEGYEITGEEKEDKILDKMLFMYPNSKILLTLGSKGAYYADKNQRLFHDIYKVKVVDTTGAGDTFTGYFLTFIVNGHSIEKALDIASKASSIAVSRSGASSSIPVLSEVSFGLF